MAGRTRPEGGGEAAAGEPSTSALARGLSLLEAFGTHDGWLANAELAQRTGLSRSTVSRLCATLVELGYLRQDARGRFRPGLRQLALSQPLLHELPIRARARAGLQALANGIGGSATLVAAGGLQVLPVEAARSPALHALRADVRLDDSLAATAAGRALLAAMDDAARAAALQALQAQPGWPGVQDKVARALQDCATQGFCLSFDDDDPTQRSLGVPLLRLADGMVLALQAAVPAYRTGRARMAKDIAPLCLALAVALRATARDIGL